MIAEKDYYKILGVDENAGKDEIKKVYRRLAKQYHPDSNKGNKNAEERFKEINEAFSVLGDDEKRKKYDQFRKYGGQPGGHSMSWEDLMREFGMGGPTGRHKGFGFQDFEINLGLDDLFGSFFSGDRRSGGHPNQRIHVEYDAPFAKENLDVRVEAKLNLAQAILGTKIRVRTPSGSKVDLRIPPGTQPGKSFRLQKMGKESRGQKGDLFITINVEIPSNLTAEQKELIEKFARSSGMEY